MTDPHASRPASAITAVAMDYRRTVADDEVTEVMEGGDPVFLTITVDRGDGDDAYSEEELSIELKAADSAQADATTR